MTHDELKEEAHKLDQTVAAIDAEIAYLSRSRPQTAAYTTTANEQQRVHDEKLEHLIDARPRPYVGRVDFQTDDERIVGYVGKTHIRDADVYSWTSPFAQVYYASPDRLSVVQAPQGPLRGRVVLKRAYEIADARLLKVSEQFRIDAPTDGVQDFLVEQLGGHRGGAMRDAIATIQPDQYEQIAASDGQVLLIQGVAGSGKSVVGLHRVAFLVSPLNGRSARPTASKVVFFGPSNTFLDYVGNLLPSLDVRDVAHRTIDSWLLSTLPRTLQLDHRDALFERLLRQSPKQAESTLRAVRIKGSLEMAAALDRFVRRRRQTFVDAVQPIAVVTSVGMGSLDAAAIRALMRSLGAAPLNQQRQALIERIVDALTPRNSGLDRETQRTRARVFRKEAGPAVERQIQAFWPMLEVVREYRQLLSDADLLEHASRGRWRADTVALAASLPRTSTLFHAEDLAALAYLDRLLNARPLAGFEHVVVDEAQEVSPMEMLVIKQHTRGTGFTILGDLAQNLSPNGVEHWQELLKPLGSVSTRRFRVRSSFRATVELTRLANAVLKVARPRSASAIPVNRHGERPVFRRSSSYADMLKAIADDIQALRADGVRTIAVACKTVAEARRVHADLVRQGVTSAELLDARSKHVAELTVGPAYMMRGLEYDAVILSGAHNKTYTGTPLHNKLLYVAVTRAAHRLNVHWFGTLASALGPRRRLDTTAGNRRQPVRRSRAATKNSNARPSR